MRAVRLLEHAVAQKPETVLDVGVGKGQHAFTFLAQGCRVTGLDVAPPQFEHPLYEHVHSGYELVDFGDQQFDMIWCSHTLEHIPNIQHFLIHLRKWLKPVVGYLLQYQPRVRIVFMWVTVRYGPLHTWSIT